MATTVLAFRFLEAGVSVQMWQHPHRDKVITSISGFKYFWLLVQLGLQIGAQYTTYKTLYFRKIKKQCDPGVCERLTKTGYEFQYAEVLTDFVSQGVLLIALVLIKKQQVVKKQINLTLMLGTCAFVLLTCAHRTVIMRFF